MPKINQFTYILIILAGIYILPLIIANTYYIDDMGRAIFGYGWEDDGRFIATLISKVLAFQSSLTSLYPFSILMATLIIVYSGAIITSQLGVYSHSDEFKLSNLSPLLLLMSPFLLENLAYRFDSLYMALSILFAVIPLIFHQHKYFISISIIMTFGLYQSTAMLYFASLLCLQIKFSLTGKNIQWKLHISALISFIIAFIMYQAILKLGLDNVSRNDFLPMSIESIHIIQNRLYSYAQIYSTLFISSRYLLALSFMLLSAVIGLSIQLNRLPSFSIKIQKLFVIILSLLGISLCTLLPNLVIQTMWLTARTFIVFPVFLIILALFIYPVFSSSSKLCRYIASAGYLILFIYSFMLSSVFGTILKNNDQFHDFLAAEITSTILRQNNQSSKDITLIITGKATLAYKSQLLYHNYPIMNLLAPNYLRENWFWGLKRLSTYYPFIWPDNKEAIAENKCLSAIIAENNFYTLYRDHNNYIIDFEKNCPL